MSAIVVETRRAFTPAEVDDMELWLIAELLGLNDPAAEEGGDGALSEDEFRRRAEDLNVERVRRANAGLPPPPVPASATPQVTDAMMEALAARRRERAAQQQGA